uniref:hypothetical protein n=1 Tax=Sulfuriferula sp. GW6 TaxID=3345112 RepID=UPI0039F729F0
MTRRRAHTTSDKKERLHVQIPAHIDTAVREYAASRRMTLADVTTKALTSLLSPGAQDQRDAIIANRLTALQSQIEQARAEIELLTELVAVLTQMSLAVDPEPSTPKQTAEWDAKVLRRWPLVLNRIVDRTNAGNTMFEALRKRLDLTPEAFNAPPAAGGDKK